MSMEGSETESETVQDPCCMNIPNYWGFQHADWHDSCLQKCVIGEKICAVFLSITGEVAARIFSEAQDANHKVDHLTSLTEGQIERLSQFCLYLLSKVIMENKFSWGDVMNLRLYIPTTLDMPMEPLSAIFTSAFNQLAEVDQRVKIDREPIFNLVPVLGAGKSAASMNDIITFELFAQRS
ncbi:hypothetical protein Patl1_23154 [Pistacia atlantica]|uniref:Uncharacterized protein n=1 Tax=Pistacia atlantica TaxID=434234 RepID=A0ACC1A0X0_9ROSI|nr:hypothetical protein Patl1_23154 [Pistacia atlantica]